MKSHLIGNLPGTLIVEFAAINGLPSYILGNKTYQHSEVISFTASLNGLSLTSIQMKFCVKSRSERLTLPYPNSTISQKVVLENAL